MSEPDPNPTSPIHLYSVTHALDEQVSIFEELLGDPLALVAAAEQKHELILAPPDASGTIHPERGCERVKLGDSMEAVRAAFGEPSRIGDLSSLGDDFQHFGITWDYPSLGVSVEFLEGKVAKLTFHSGTYRGGLIPTSWQRWDGKLAPDLSFEAATEAALASHHGPPTKAYDDDPELCELLDEEPTRTVVYPGWTFEFLLDGRLQSISVPTNSIPWSPPAGGDA